MSALHRVLICRPIIFCPKSNLHEDMAHLQKGLSAFTHAMQTHVLTGIMYG